MSAIKTRVLGFTIPSGVGDVKEVRMVLVKAGTPLSDAAGTAAYENTIGLDTDLAHKEDTPDGLLVKVPVAQGSKLDGTYDLYLWLIDDFGNESEVPAMLPNVAIDYVPPPTPVNLRLVD